MKKKNRFKLGTWITSFNPSALEIISDLEFDWICVDMEHSTINNYEAQRIISTVQAYEVPCIPRPLSHKNDIIKPLHHRMPVVVPNGYEKEWTELVKGSDELKGLLPIMRGWSSNGWVLDNINKKQTDQMSLF